MGDKQVIRYEGEKQTVDWDGRLCIHIGECGRATGDLFVGGRKPWCQPDLAGEDEVMEVIQRCPSGALVVRDKAGVNPETPAAVNTIHVTYNGPLYLRGALAIDGAPANAEGVRFRAALCRCGKSNNKPFCDNSHVKAGFRDSGAVGDKGEPSTEPGGTLTVKPAKDGPYLVNGSVTIVAGSGRTAWHGTRAALCRCGASGNKPFCDGSHKKTGFKS